jgi:hypothetical protein
LTQSLKAPGFNPCTYQVKNGFKPSLSKCNLYRYSSGSLFSEHDMADASEALQKVFEAVHRAVVPKKGSKHAKPITPPPPPAGAPGCPDAQSSSASGLFLDQECGYNSVVHRCFGLDVEVGGCTS